MKVINFKGLTILIAMLLAVQVLCAMILSPILGPAIIESINKSTDAKISIEKVTVWPLTLSCSLKNFKIFDPDNEEERIALIEKASLKLSLIGLLSKRLIVSRFNITDALINLKGEADGSFNIQKIAARSEQKEVAKKSLFDRFGKKKDWFGRIFDMVKSKSSKETDKKKEPKKVKKQVKTLHKGRRVEFLKSTDRYVFQIIELSIKNSSVTVESDAGETINVNNANIYIKNFGLDPKLGASFDRLGARGVVNKNDDLAGSFDLDYGQSFKHNRQDVTINISVTDLDLAAVKFIYENSIPVSFEKGRVTVKSHTNILDGELDSANSLTLSNHNVLPKGKQLVGFIPLPVICEALNKIDPVKMKFQIAGTADNPQFKEFEKILLDLIKPYVANVAENVKEEGLKALGNLFKKEESSEAQHNPSEENDSTAKTINSIKNLFGNKGK